MIVIVRARQHFGGEVVHCGRKVWGSGARSGARLRTLSLAIIKWCQSGGSM
jgi:hypothetical protein